MTPNLLQYLRPARLASMALLVGLGLEACSWMKPAAPPVPAPTPVKPASPAPSPAPAPVKETRKSSDAIQIVPIPGAEKAEIRVGDKLWYRGGEGIVRPTTILREVLSIQGGQVQYKQFDVDANGRVSNNSRARRQSTNSLELDNPAKASGQVRYVDFPLGLGKTWSYRYQLKSKNGALTTYDIAARVESEENITTPAGTFKALRILHGGQWNVPVVQGGIVKVSSGSLRSTLWFAPTLGNWVRFESEILNSDGGLEAKVSQELVRLDRRADN
jgi:hypothetical protein